ncbi:ATP-binding protein [Patescibacteria group bacterium]
MKYLLKKKCLLKNASDSWRRIARFLFCFLFKARSKTEDLRRREFILNVLLAGTILLTATFSIFVLYYWLTDSSYRGVSVIIITSILLVFISLYALSRIGWIILSSYLLITIYFISVTYTAYVWGVDLPQVLLTYAMIIVVAGVLLGTRFSFGITTLIAVTALSLGYLQATSVIEVDGYWRSEMLTVGDVFEYVVTLGIITLVSWLSNREIERSLKRARKSEAELKIERDMLEDKVVERTEELKRIQYEKNRQVFKMAEFGKLSSGLFHDLSNYLTVLFLSIEKTEMGKQANLSETKEDIKRVNVSLDKTREFLIAMQRQLKWENKKVTFSLADEIESVIQMLSYEIKRKDIQVFFDSNAKNNFLLYGDLAKFNQIMINLLINAIDSYHSVSRGNCNIDVELREAGEFFEIVIRDYGEGIDECVMQNIFDPFFTTKEERGTGIGLTTVKDIISRSFDGGISVKNNKTFGTEFTIKIKQKVNNEEKSNRKKHK